MQFLFELVETFELSDLFAQGVDPAPAGGEGGEVAPGGNGDGDAGNGGGGFGGFGGFLPLMLMMVAVVVIMSLFSARPAKKEQAKRQEMLDNLKKNDRVLTAGGIVGNVVNIEKEKDFVTLRIDATNNTRLKVLRTSIARVLTDEDKKGISDKED